MLLHRSLMHQSAGHNSTVQCESRFWINVTRVTATTLSNVHDVKEVYNMIIDIPVPAAAFLADCSMTLSITPTLKTLVSSIYWRDVVNCEQHISINISLWLFIYLFIYFFNFGVKAKVIRCFERLNQWRFTKDVQYSYSYLIIISL